MNMNIYIYFYGKHIQPLLDRRESIKLIDYRDKLSSRKIVQSLAITRFIKIHHQIFAHP